jgi:DNA-binding transcriptional regulator YhcF (GntR family)
MATDLAFGALMFVLMLTPLVLVAALGRHLRQPRGNDVVWLLGTPAPSRASAELVARYLYRVRTHRRLGAWTGAVLALGVGLSREREITIGIGGGTPLGDLLFGGLAGLLVGSVLADSWRLRPSRDRRAADLTVRTVDAGARALHPAVVVLTAVTVLLAVSEPGLRSLGLAAASGVLALTHRAGAAGGRPARPAVAARRPAQDRRRHPRVRRATDEPGDAGRRAPAARLAADDGAAGHASGAGRCAGVPGARRRPALAQPPGATAGRVGPSPARGGGLMHVAIDTTSPLPVYEQLRSQLQRLISSGQLPVGARLPTIRQMAKDLGLASATVSRVYDLLASDGWVVAAGRNGTVVSRAARPAELRREMSDAAEHLALLSSQLGVERDDVVRLLDEALAGQEAPAQP